MCGGDVLFGPSDGPRATTKLRAYLCMASCLRPHGGVNTRFSHTLFDSQGCSCQSINENLKKKHIIFSFENIQIVLNYMYFSIAKRIGYSLYCITKVQLIFNRDSFKHSTITTNFQNIVRIPLDIHTHGISKISHGSLFESLQISLHSNDSLT